jgi:hypothetical protein
VEWVVTVSVDQTFATAQKTPAKTVQALVHSIDLLAKNAGLATEEVTVAVMAK